MAKIHGAPKIKKANLPAKTRFINRVITENKHFFIYSWFVFFRLIFHEPIYNFLKTIHPLPF